MTEADKPRFMRALGALAEVYGDSLSEARYALYFMALSRFAIQALESAIGSLVAEPGRKFMPRPGEIVEAIEGLPQDRALAAWVRIERAAGTAGPYASVDFGDPIIHAMIVRSGGWVEVANWFRDYDAKDLGYRRHQFVQEYQVAERMAGEAIDHLPGIFETQNNATLGSWTRGDMEHRDHVVAIGPDGRPTDRRALPDRRPVGALPETTRNHAAHSHSGQSRGPIADVRALVKRVTEGLPGREDVLRDKVRFDRGGDAA